MTITERLEALGRTPAELLSHVDQSGASAEDVLSNWEADGLTAAAWLGHANEWLRLPLDRGLTAFMEERGDETAYVFVGREGAQRVTAKQLVEFRYAQPAIMAATGLLVEGQSKAGWHRIVRALLRAKTANDLGDEATPRGRGRAWLRAYLDARKTLNGDDYPFTLNGRTHLLGSEMRRWLLTSRGERLTDVQFGRVMRAAGCEPRRVAAQRDDGQPTTRSAWLVPEDLDEP